MENTTRIILLVNSNKHYLDKVLALAPTGPLIDVDPALLRYGDEIAAEGQALCICEVRTLQPYPERDSFTPIVVYPHENHYVVLAGKTAVQQLLTTGKPIKARLISKPSLKKARVPEEVLPVREVKRDYAEEFANRPRIVDKRTQYGDNSDHRTQRPTSYPRNPATAFNNAGDRKNSDRMQKGGWRSDELVVIAAGPGRNHNTKR